MGKWECRRMLLRLMVKAAVKNKFFAAVSCKKVFFYFCKLFFLNPKKMNTLRKCSTAEGFLLKNSTKKGAIFGEKW